MFAANDWKTFQSCFDQATISHDIELFKYMVIWQVLEETAIIVFSALVLYIKCCILILLKALSNEIAPAAPNIHLIEVTADLREV
jgi:hypothetical protein